MNKKLYIYLSFIGFCILTIGISLGFIIGFNAKKTKTVINNSNGIIYNHSTEYPVAEDDFVNPSGDIDGFLVTYKCNNGYTYTSTTKNNKVIKPTDPKKIYSSFLGWYSDALYENVYDFDNLVNDDITIYAKWDIDYPNLLTYMYQNTILANMKIICYRYTYYQTPKGISYIPMKETTLGSAEIIYENDTYYYALTNNHVIYQENPNLYYKYIAYDSYDREYDNGYYEEDKQITQVIYADKDYDLALLRIKKIYTTDPLQTVKFAQESPTLYGEDVITMGYPNGLTNALSLGKTIEYKEFTPDKTYEDESNVTFDVLCHTSYITSGSSGGALLDTNLKLIGINFASATNSKDEYLITYSIPIEKIIEFIDNYNNQ